MKKRRGNFRPQREIIVIVSQGSSTEPGYFKNYKKRNSHVRLDILKTQKGNDPISLIKYTKYLKEDVYGIRKGDKIYCVYDVDSTPEAQLKNAEELASKCSINVCVSNPCFEIWYLLHFDYSTSQLSSYADVKVKLLRHIHDYEKDKEVYDILHSHQQEAISNAKKLEKHHCDIGSDSSIRGCNPSTRVYELVEYLNNIIE